MRLDALTGTPDELALALSRRAIFPGRDFTDPTLVAWWFKFSEDAQRVKIPLRVHSSFRTHDQQQDLFDRGVTRARPGQSAHNYGRALDIIHTKLVWVHMPEDGWEILGQIGKEAARKLSFKVEWGGDWNREKRGGLGWDPAHWQIADWPNKPYPIR